MTNTERSDIFAAYNAARHLAATGQLDKGRTDRALGVALRKEQRPYNTTPWSCDCPDRQYRHATCKHMIAASMRAAVQDVPASEYGDLPDEVWS